MPITPSTTPTEQLDRLLRQFPALSPTATQQLTALYPLYREWNARINVISRRDIDNLYLHHVMHSLALAWLLPDEPTSFTIADVGCGGGFPSIPLAILFPQYQFLLIDSIAKKLHVAQSIADEIGLTNVSTHHTRVESCDLRCDYVVSRAAMPLELLYKYTRHMLHGSTLWHLLSQGRRPQRGDSAGGRERTAHSDQYTGRLPRLLSGQMDRLCR